jgi:hypothetical protein
MSSSSADSALSSDEALSAARRAAKARRIGIRGYFAIEENAAVTAFAQSAAGRVVLFLLFVPVLAYFEPNWLPIAAGAALCAYAGRYRGYALTSTTFVVLALNTSLFGLYPFAKSQAAAYACFFAFSLAYLLIARRAPNLFVARRPVVSLLGLIAFLVGIATSPLLAGPALNLLWAFIEVFVKYMWFLAYALADQRARMRSPLYFQFGTFNPFWGSTATPFGKGAAYLRKVMAKTPEELAVTQIKGLKLLYWSLVLSALRKLLKWVMYGQFQLPLLADVQSAHAAGHPYPVTVGWTSLVWATAEHTLSLAIFGHRVVAIARLAGFRLQRNTWRPLESQTLVDFWNRYYFYFKELLVEFFFFPTFLSTFRSYPRLRMFFAIFMAAGVGNALYHFVRDIAYVRSAGLWNAAASFESYLFYCVVLATGIGISQARTHRANSSFIDWLWSFTCVWSFVVLLHVFGDETRVYTLGERLSFIFSLFGAK